MCVCVCVCVCVCMCVCVCVCVCWFVGCEVINYSCMPNMKNIINSHNNMIIKNNRTNPPTPRCICRIQHSCPLNGESLTTELVYQATVTRNDNQHEDTYIGLK